MTPLLGIEDLHVEANGRRIIEGVSLPLAEGEMVAESGWGKSVTALAPMHPLAEPSR